MAAGSIDPAAQGPPARLPAARCSPGCAIAWPAAVLGAVIGEYIGGTSGLGVFMLASETAYLPAADMGHRRSSSPPWPGIGYGLTALAERILVPWARRQVR